MRFENDWDTYPLCDIIDINPKRTIKKGTVAKFVSMGDIKENEKTIEYFERREFKGGAKFTNTDTLMARITPCLENGKTAYVDFLDKNEIAFGSTEFMVLSAKDGITTPQFVYYLSRWPYVRNRAIKSMSGTSGRQRVDKDAYSHITVPLPSIPAQQEIEAFLKSLDDKIELNRRMNATLEQIAQAIFKQWFIDFEFPDENGQPYKSSGGEMVESELGEIPRGWEVKAIGDICKTFGGGTPKTKEPSYWEDGDIFWATPTDMTSLKSPIIFDTSRKITEEGLNKSSAKLLPIESVLMTSRATLGYFAIAKVPICTNQGFISMVCDGEISNYYLLHALKNKVGLIENLASGSTYLEINKSSFRSISIIKPPSSIIEKFDNFVKLIYDKIYLYELESQNLSLIRDELLPKLMSGKIRLL